MQIRAKITEQEFIKLNYQLLYRKPLVRILTALALLVGTYSIVCLFNPKLSGSAPWGFPFAVLIAFPAVIYIAAKKSFKTNPRMSEDIQYFFDADTLRVVGESFESKQTWEKVHRVTLDKNWLLIWQNGQMAHVIPRKAIWEGDLILREILDSKSVKNNLKVNGA